MNKEQKLSKKALRSKINSFNFKNIMPAFSTIQEAVEATGGHYDTINDSTSVDNFVDSVFDKGLTSIDDSRNKALFGPIDVKGEITNPKHQPGGYINYQFCGPQGLKIKVNVDTPARPMIFIHDYSGGIVDGYNPHFDDKNKEFTTSLPYTGNYSVKMYYVDNDTGSFVINFDIIN